MVNKQVIDTFKQFCSNWFGETNEYDCFYRKIPDGVKNEVRQNFGINFKSKNTRKKRYNTSQNSDTQK